MGFKERILEMRPVTRRALKAVIAAVGGGTLLLAATGSPDACAMPRTEAAVALAPNFGGVAVTGLSCPPDQRGVNIKDDGKGSAVKHIVASAGGADFYVVNLGPGDSGFVRVPESTVAEDANVALRAEDLNTHQVLGQTQQTMDCVPNQTSTTSPVTAPTTTAPSSTTTVTFAPTTQAPRPSIPGSETGQAAPTVTSSTTLLPINQAPIETTTVVTTTSIAPYVSTTTTTLPAGSGPTIFGHPLARTC